MMLKQRISLETVLLKNKHFIFISWLVSLSTIYSNYCQVLQKTNKLKTQTLQHTDRTPTTTQKVNVYHLCSSMQGTSLNWGLMRVQLASPELHKHLRFLSNSSIKEKKQEIPESQWTKRRLFTTTSLLLCPIHTYTIANTSCMMTFNLQTARRTSATLRHNRDLKFTKS